MYTYITKAEQLGEYTQALKGCDIVYFDTETTGLDPFTEMLLLIQMKIKDQIFIFDVQRLGHQFTKYVVQVLKNSNALVVGANLKFDLKFIQLAVDELLTNVYCTQLAEVMTVNGLGGNRYPSLGDLTKKYCSVILEKETRNNFIGNYTSTFTEQDLIYSALDVMYLGKIRDAQIAKLTEQKQMRVLDLECKLLPVIVSMELAGVTLDKEKWLVLSDKAKEISERLEIELLDEMVDKVIETRTFANALEAVQFLHIFPLAKLTLKLQKELTGITDLSFISGYIKNHINLNSSKQLLTILKFIYGVPIENTNEKTINKFENEFPIINKLIEFREHRKSVTSFGQAMLDRISKVTGRLHTNYNQLGAQSGRISSDNPNLANIPKGQEYRSAFVAPPGSKLIAVDFSQEELRLLAKVGHVQRMIDAFNAGIDLHTATASSLYDVPVEEVTKEQRSRGKTLNFAVGYGSTEYGLYTNFGIPKNEGKALLKKFFGETYPEIVTFNEIADKFILDMGYSTTLLGRKRYHEHKVFFADYREKERWESALLRAGRNHIIQGTGAEVIKKSLCRIFYENPFGDKLKILLQVYDEIVCEVTDDIAEEAKEFISKCMVECEREFLEDVVPSVVDAQVEQYWKH
jgi:DNA polymerase-1